MPNHGFIERRLCPRFPLTLCVNCFDMYSEKKIDGQTKDISAQGLRLISDKPLLAGYKLEIFIKMSDNGEKIYRKGRVIWSNISSQNKYQVGVFFDEKSLNPVPIVLRTIMTEKNY